jgi:uncharacterized protein (DUF1501 family)
MPLSENHPDMNVTVGDGGSDHAFSRRKFLALAGGVGAVSALGATLGPKAWDSLMGGGTAHGTGAARLLSSRTGRTLVLITLYGGNDGLNTVIPYQDPNYARYRGALAVADAAVLPLGEGYGLHPSLNGLKKLWDANHLAIVQGVGFANPNYSHFESMDIWQSGDPGTPVGSGWLGRWLDRTKSNPLRVIGIGPVLPLAVVGEKVQATAVPVGAFNLPGDSLDIGLYASLAQAGMGRGRLQDVAAKSNADLVAVQQDIGNIVDRSETADPLHLGIVDRSETADPLHLGIVDRSETADPLHVGPGTPSGGEGAVGLATGGGGRSADNALATQLSVVANLILSGVKTEVYSVELGGFDTHADQADIQSNLLSQLDGSVSAFLDALSEDERGRQTVVVIYTEFGRRVWANASQGTDHGWANNVFVAGHSVRGGYFGDPPSLSKLSQGNLIYTTDFRSVYATVFDQVLGVDPRPFLGGSFRALPLL